MTDLTDATQASAHLRYLISRGVSIVAIANRLGMHPAHIGMISRREVRRVQSITLQSILDLSIEKHFTVQPTARIDGTGTRRRIQALMACGWSARAIQDESGMYYTLIIRLIRKHTSVTKLNADRIAAAYDRLWNVAPATDTPAHRRNVSNARNAAARRGYVPPLAWDDDEIDNPKAKPQTGRTRDTRVIVDEVVVERLKAGQSVPTNRIEQRTALAELVAEGVPTAEIAKRLGMGLSGAIRTRNRVTARRSAA